MAEKSIKQAFKGTLNFNHLDAHFARFAMEYDKGNKDRSEIYGKRQFTITPDMFPSDFELSKYDISGVFEFVVEIKPKK